MNDDSAEPRLGGVAASDSLDWRDDGNTIVVAMNPAAAVAPTASQGYCCVKARISAAVFAVSCIAVRVWCRAILASSACWRKNTASFCSSYPCIIGEVRGAVSELCPLLALAFGIVLYLLYARLALDPTGTDQDRDDQHTQQPQANNDLPQP